MREEIKNLIESTSQLIEEAEDFIFDNYKSSYTLFKSEIETEKENFTLIENSIDSVPDESLERVKNNLDVIRENIKNTIDSYDTEKLNTKKEENLDVNAYLDSIETIPEETPATEVLPNEFVEPYVQSAINETPQEINTTIPVAPPQIVMPTGSINTNTLDNLISNVNQIEDNSNIAFNSTPTNEINVEELDNLFNN